MWKNIIGHEKERKNSVRGGAEAFAKEKEQQNADESITKGREIDMVDSQNTADRGKCDAGRSHMGSMEEEAQEDRGNREHQPKLFFVFLFFRV